MITIRTGQDGIEQKHGGRIAVQSELGKGTAFKICLPISQSESLEAVAAVGLTLHK